ncbi:uncharacterized protein [Venturia canescens]|uniref:uncharacterized protein isoform X2 n=1 Tax=Venturia canescens TaxID=32260 RepID=UPI001C9C3126|nr:uncharacterized protein LOC122412203 isoform X2 [Venturia canescens]
MGNSGSNNSASHQQQCAPGNQEMGRGWTHSFPREHTRHHSQPPGHKVLPEPPNQRLRATNNGSIIHNGGTISGRRPSALTLPHDLNKGGVYRSRSTSASNLGPRSRSSDQNQHNCCLYRSQEGRCREHEMMELKRFGSEPDLRYSPKEHLHQNHRGHNQETRQSSYYPERESRERESRYRGKKKYKAPAPPGNGDGSSPDSYKWEIGQEGENRGEDETIQAPPRKSRLFKTRAESKKAQSNWQNGVQENESLLEHERRWRNDKSSKENRCAWRDSAEQENWLRDEKRRSKKYDGKNTLQRSLSSPEFQAELMQVARKVRNKLNYNRRVGPIGAATIISAEPKIELRNPSNGVSHREERKNPRSRAEERQDDRRTEKRKPRSVEEPFDRRREELRSSARFHDERNRSKHENRPLKEIRGYDNERIDNSRIENSRIDHGRTRERIEERIPENSHRRRIIEKSYVYEERITSNGTGELISGRKSHNERLEIVGNSIEDRHRRDFNSRNRHETNERTRNHKSEDLLEQPRTRSESPALRNCRDRPDVRGQGSGRESTPEPPRGREKNSDHRKRRNDTKDETFGINEKRWSNNNAKINGEISNKNNTKLTESKESRGKNWNGLPPSGKTAPKTYYFSIDDGLSRDIRENENSQQVDHSQTELQNRDSNNPVQNIQSRTDNSKNQNGVEDIALKLRPTLPKKQLEIPRFSPSAAWRLLSALETPGPTMSTASEEVPVMFEERIERLARPPPPLIALGPRSSHDKSGDSGISGDAGAANDDSLDVSTTNRLKTVVSSSRPAWTPQQDLGEESSSDAGVDSPPPMPPPMKFPPRPHVFSLSLPRDENRFYSVDAKATKDNSSFNSLQKLKRSVSGALGLAPNEIEERKRPGENLGENWLLSTSAPNSLQHSKSNNHESGENSTPSWENNYSPVENDEEIEEIEDNEDKTDFPMLMKPPSFSYLASGGHVMYLPETNDTEHRTQSLNYRNSANEIGNSKYRKNSDDSRLPNKIGSFGINGISINGGIRDMAIHRERSFTDIGPKSRKYPNFFKSCENISEMRQRSASPVHHGPESLQDPKTESPPNAKNNNAKNQKGKRFTFQSTVRQIERRRLAEKLSREAEAKERQRKSELEVMRKVEEEFQRKRAREKANIRQQLRLYTMDENSSLPPAWDSSQLSRADPDGAPSSSASSPTSAPPGKMANRKNSIGSDEYQHRKRVSESRAQQQQQQQPVQQREYKDYRPKYYDWAPDSSSHLDAKQTTVHPKVVYDIPKSSHVFVDANIHTAKPANVISTPRSDNYSEFRRKILSFDRKDFAHGAVAGKSSLASSDSELSQPNTRPHSRQNGNKCKSLRSRSVSPARSEGAGCEESPVEAIKQERNTSTNGFMLNGVQPFVREKSYRPIAFKPRPPPPIPS